jgi:hypothetical protein
MARGRRDHSADRRISRRWMYFQRRRSNVPNFANRTRFSA